MISQRATDQEPQLTIKTQQTLTKKTILNQKHSRQIHGDHNVNPIRHRKQDRKHQSQTITFKIISTAGTLYRTEANASIQ